MLLSRVSKSLVIAVTFVLILGACGSPTPTITPQPVNTTVPPTSAAAAATTAATAAATVAAAAPTTAATVAATTAATVATQAATTAVAQVSSPTTVATTAATVAATATTAASATNTASPTTAATAAATTAPTTAAATAAATTAATSAPAATQEALASKPSTLPECKSSGTLTVGSDATYPPFESINETTGKIEGFDIDLLTAIGQKEGFTIEPHNAMFDTIFTALSYGQYNIVISASTITPERQQTVNFSNPYFVAGQVIVVRKADIGKIKTTADLSGKSIGVQLGTTGAEAAKKIPNTKEVKEFATAPEAFQALANSTVDAVVNDNVTSLSIILNSPNLNLAVVGQPFTQEFYGIAIRKECTDLLKKVNDGLGAVIADGTYAQIYSKYLGELPGPEFQKGGAGVPAVPAPTAAATAATTGGSSGGGATAAATTAPTMAATP